MTTKQKKYFLFVILCLFILLLAWRMVSHSSSKTRRAHSTNEPVAVLVTLPVKKVVSNDISVVGSIAADQQTYITPKTAGYISAILFKEGQFVKAGTPVIKLDDRKIRAQVAADKTNYEINQRRYLIDKAIAKKGIITKLDLEAAQTAAANSRSTLTQDEELLDQTVLRAPFDGYLAAKTISVGDYVNAAQQLVLLVDRNHLEVEYSVQEKYASSLHQNQIITLTSQLDSKKHLQAVISYISPSIDSTTRTIAVHAQIKDPLHLLLPGQYVSVKQPLTDPIAGLFIPEEAIVPSLEGDSVYVATGGLAKQVPVTLGIRKNGLVEIKTGLSLTNQVVIEGQEKLHNGQAITLQMSAQDART